MNKKVGRKAKLRRKQAEVKEKPEESRKEPFLSKVPDWAVLLFFCFLFLTETILSISQKSATFDETAHLPAGYMSLKFGDYGFNPAHPPLVKMLAAVPLLFVEVKRNLVTKPIKNWPDAISFLYDDNDADRLLFLGRVAVLPLALLLGWVVFLWTKRLFGREAAIFALFLYSFEPNILAHAPLVTTDFGASCFMFIAIYFFYRLAHTFSIAHLLLFGLSVGLAFVTKFVSLQLVPILFLLGIVVIFVQHSVDVDVKGVFQGRVIGRTKKFVVLLLAMIGVGLAAYVVIWAAYRFRYEGISLPGHTYEKPWSKVLPDEGLSREAVLWLREAKVLPEAFFYGIFAISHTLVGRATFLMGEVSTDGWWYYFIVTFLLKTPLPFLIFLLATPFAMWPYWRKDPVAVLCLLLPVVIYFGIASVSRLNIGHRHLLPIYPFLFVMAASLVPWMMNQRALIKGVMGVLAFWYLVSSVLIFPNYLAYFNELAGGPDNGYKYLVDSNLDWGQDLKGLKRYMDEHGINQVWLSYFGLASPDYYGISYNYLPSYVILGHKSDADIEPTPYVAISATNLQGVYLPYTPGGAVNENYFADYRERKPIAKIGYSIFIYRID